MKIPKNMTEEETLDKINLVVDRISPKYTFFGYDVNDIKQEAFIICVEALERYDQKRPLENFLSVNLSNRLKNFVRDNFGNAKDIEKKKISCPTAITHEYSRTLSYQEDVDLKLDMSDIREKIDKELHSSYRADYLKFINNITIPKPRRDNLIQELKDIVNEDR